GQNRSYSNERWSYQDKILYSWGWPVGRLVRVPKDGNYAFLSRNGGRVKAPSNWMSSDGPIITHTLFVDCVGAFSPYAADTIDDAALHERTRWLAMLAAQAVVENAFMWPIDKLMAGNRYAPGKAVLMTAMKEIIKRYDLYNQVFDLK